MPFEIERRFILNDQNDVDAVFRFCSSRAIAKKSIRQVYLEDTGSWVIRARSVVDPFADDEKFYLTLKQSVVSSNFTSHEIDPEVQRSVVGHLFEDGDLRGLQKVRLDVEGDDDMIWHVDFFKGMLEGLVIAEIELPSETTEFEPLRFFTKEVTGENRYSNFQLAHLGWKNS